MSTSKTVLETLELIWGNYVLLSEKVDLEWMPPESIDALVVKGELVRPFRIAIWSARQGHFISVWSLWEYYARSLCRNLPNKVNKNPQESTVEWIDRSLSLNGLDFTDKDWFVGANVLRNLIAHGGARIACTSDGNKLARVKTVMPEIELWKDGYIDITHSIVADLQHNVEEFVCETAATYDRLA